MRKYKGKNCLNVLDFIGNYKKTNLVLLFLTGEAKTAEGSRAIPNGEVSKIYLKNFRKKVLDECTRI